MDKEIKELEEMSDYNTDPSWDDLYEAWKDEEHKNRQLEAENKRLKEAILTIKYSMNDFFVELTEYETPEEGFCRYYSDLIELAGGKP